MGGGVSQNRILWEALPWQGIPAGKWLPHPCHGHSRGPPPLDRHAHAALLPTGSEGLDPRLRDSLFSRGFGAAFLLFVKCLSGGFRVVTYSGGAFPRPRSCFSTRSKPASGAFLQRWLHATQASLRSSRAGVVVSAAASRQESGGFDALSVSS